MSVYVKISSTLRPYIADYQPAKGLWIEGAGKTAAELADTLGLPLTEIKFVMINGKQLPMESMLAENDRVAFFPAVGGG